VEHGSRINYYPAGDERPFLADSLNTNFSLKFLPAPQLQIDETYIFTRLAADGRGTVFNNHIWRTKVNYQFTREMSLRVIADYNAVLPNAALVNLERRKRLGLDVLFTYMLHPGTAFHLGYTDNYENLRYDPAVSPQVQRGSFPDTSTGRMIFAKFSYLLRI
jgi:transglutaminase-like putative cysteine protease